MKTIYLDKEYTSTTPCVATIGFFDGVHRGHQFLIRQLVQLAKEHGWASRLITFDKHPRQVLKKDFQPKMLTTFEEKLQLLSETGVDECVVLPFSEQMAALSAYEFMKMILQGQLNVRLLYVGYDHRFGNSRIEGYEDYVRYGKELGIEVKQSVVYPWEDINVSSSVIRRFIQAGEMEKAVDCLGHSFMLTGCVVHGEQQGRKMGFPTANIQLDNPEKLLPAVSVYAVQVSLEGHSTTYTGMMNIGTRPTFNGDHQTIEVHLFHFSDDLYGKRLRIDVKSRVRDEQQFASPEALREQLEKDEEQIIQQFEKEQ
ncbi:MAG: bifunctional riboflavin kinase/FAD synthetase [Prevotella sp.]|nr:bifunctional riboflavin kinase/FAD synthetase [Prevotella sp.]